MQKYSEIIKQIEENKKTLEFLPTGFSLLDHELDGGFMRKELVVLGGYTGIGKSFIAGQILYNIASKGFKSGYFSLEISNSMLVARLIGALSNIKATRIIAGFLTKEEQQDKINAKTKISLIEQFIDFYDELYSLDEITMAIKQQGYEFVVVDFIQNVFLKGTDEYTRLSTVALELQKLAKETNCCILVVSQLSNSAAKAGNSGLVEYKGSGSIATVCDLGFVIERSEIEGAVENNIFLNLRKNRRGISGLSFGLLYKSPGGWLRG